MLPFFAEGDNFHHIDIRSGFFKQNTEREILNNGWVVGPSLDDRANDLFLFKNIIFHRTCIIIHGLKLGEGNGLLLNTLSLLCALAPSRLKHGAQVVFCVWHLCEDGSCDLKLVIRRPVRTNRSGNHGLQNWLYDELEWFTEISEKWRMEVLRRACSLFGFRAFGMRPFGRSSYLWRIDGFQTGVTGPFCWSIRLGHGSHGQIISKGWLVPYKESYINKGKEKRMVYS